MRDNKTFLTATTALVSCLSLVAPQMTLAQGNSNTGADKLPVCSSVEADVPCREPGEKGKAKGKEGDAPAEQTAEEAPASEAPEAAEAGESDDAPEAQDAVEAPEVKPGADPEQAPEAAGAEDAPAEAPKTETAEPATPATPATPAEGAEDADKARAAEDATPPKKPAGAAEEQTAEDADDSQRPKSRAEAEAEAEADVQTEAEAEAEADVQTEVEAEAEAEADGRTEEQTADSLEEELRDEDAQPSADAESEAEVDEQTADTAPEASESTASAAPGDSGETPAAVRAEGEPEEVEETTVTEQTARSSDEEFKTRVDAEAETQADADAKTQADADAKTQADGGGGGGGLSDFEKFAIGAAGLVALDALLDNDDEVVTNSGDRVVVRRDGNLEVYRDDNELLRRPGSQVRTETYSDGSTRTVVTRENGTQIVTITDATGRVLRRTKIRPNGTEVILIDDTHQVAEVDVRDLPRSNKDYVFDDRADRDALRAALRADAAGDLDRSFSLYQVRNIPQVRELMPEITVDAINFRTDSAAIQPREAEELRALGEAINEFLEENPDELFLIEGHTDAVGDAAYNLALSDRRAESVALALTEYFDVPPENMVIQGYGESQLREQTEGASRMNRRAVVRRVTPLLETASR